MNRRISISFLLLLLVAGCRYSATPFPSPANLSSLTARAEDAENVPPPSPAPLNSPAHTPDDNSASKPAKILDELTTREYRIGAGDVIEVFAVDIEEINDSYTVGPDGRISLPYVGIIDLQGVTRAEAGVQIEEKLKAQYLNPQVNVVVEEYNNNRVFVLGEVRWPGEFNFAGPPTLLGALARAQGLTDNADLRGCTIIRGRGTLIEVNLYDLLRKGNRQLNLPLLPEDTVYVKSDDDNTYYVLGEVGHPGAYPRTQNVDIIEAIARAGGLSEDARKQNVKLIRRRDEGAPPQITTYNLDQFFKKSRSSDTPAVERADIVYVPTRRVAGFNYILRQITPSLNLYLLGESVAETADGD